MKNLIVICTVLSVTACNTTPVVEPRVQSLEDAIVTLDSHAEKVAMNKMFCEGRGFDYYAETSVSYTFRCQYRVDENGSYLGGGYFHLVK